MCLFTDIYRVTGIDKAISDNSHLIDDIIIQLEMCVNTLISHIIHSINLYL